MTPWRDVVTPRDASRSADQKRTILLSHLWITIVFFAEMTQAQMERTVITHRPSQPSSRRCDGRIILPQNNLAHRQWITSVINVAHGPHTGATRTRRKHRPMTKEGASSVGAKQFHTPALWLKWHQLERCTSSRLCALWKSNPKDHGILHFMDNSQPQLIIPHLWAPDSFLFSKICSLWLSNAFGNDSQRVLHVWHLTEQLPFTITMWKELD